MDDYNYIFWRLNFYAFISQNVQKCLLAAILDHESQPVRKCQHLFKVN